MNVALFLTYDMSLKDWDEKDILDREMSLYLQMSEKYSVNYTFITFGDEGDYKYADKLKNIKILPAYAGNRKFNSKIFRFFNSFLIPFRLKKELKDINILKTNQLLGAWIPIILKFITKKPLIIRTGYDLLQFSLKERRGLSKYIFYYILTQIALWSASVYTVSSEDNSKFLKDKFWFNGHKLIKVYNWVEISDYLNLENRYRNKILAVGRLESQKNYASLIKNLENFSLDLDIVGEGSLKNSLVKSAEELKVNVSFLGTVSHNELLNLYSQYSYFVMFSKFEGHPKSLIEAMSKGCVPIVLNASYLDEIIKNKFNGIILNSETESIGPIIKSLNNNFDTLAELSLNAYKFSKKNYSIDRILEKEYLFYQDLSL
jgi:glycosyltransferase involved in cell wall biosynthesis